MSKRHMVTLHHMITVCREMSKHINGIMQTLAEKRTPQKEDLSPGS